MSEKREEKEEARSAEREKEVRQCGMSMEVERGVTAVARCSGGIMRAEEEVRGGRGLRAEKFLHPVDSALLVHLAAEVPQ